MSLPAFFEEIGIKESNDPLLKEICHDLEGKTSPLELMSSYLGEVKGTLNNDPHTFAKLAKLFEKGRTPEKVEGHFYGVTMGLRSGNRKSLLLRYFNVLNFFWGTLLASAPPWVGKGFTLMDNDLEEKYLKGFKKAGVDSYLGINFFRKNNASLWNRISIPLMTVPLGVKNAPEEEADKYGYDMNGGVFISMGGKSVNPGSEEKGVFQINYRFPSIENRFPLKYLIDEIVEVAPGLYLGQLLFATKRLFRRYDPALPDRKYGYTHSGFFLLMDEKWDEERRKYLPYTEDIWRTKASSIEWKESPKFTNFTFAEPSDGKCNEDVLKEIMKDMEGKETILDLLKFYSEELEKDCDINSPYFAKLFELFNRGIAPKEVRGYFHGAAVAFRNAGYLKIFDINTLNLAWPLARHFSPWTGKTFEDIDVNKLKELTDGFEKGEIPTFWGTNAYAERTVKQKMVVEAMRIAKVDLQDATEEEARTGGFDVKSFFFVARQDTSVNPANNNKTVFQFNYRWPKLETLPPDNFCIDELVQIADGLYIGQLIYATNLFEKYEPTKPSSAFDYRNFGYFLLMDDEWHARRKEIGYDLIPSEE